MLFAELLWELDLSFGGALASIVKPDGLAAELRVEDPSVPAAGSLSGAEAVGGRLQRLVRHYQQGTKASLAF